MRAIQQTRIGGSDVLELLDLPKPVPADGEVLIRVTSAGVNFADTLIRRGRYPRQPPLPAIPGLEVIGTREDTRERVLALCEGGGYAEWIAVPAARTFAVPDGIEDRTALALLIQGLTAWGLCHEAARIGPGDTVVVHGATGGVGSIATQLASALGARVIATASTERKLEIAHELGAVAAVSDAPAGLGERLLEANGGRPVDVVLDAVGGEVFDQSLAVLAPYGRLINYGTQSGVAPTIDTRMLMGHQALVGGFYLYGWMEIPDVAQRALSELLARTRAGTIRPLVNETYDLEQAAEAQLDVEARRTVGKVALTVA